MAGSCTSRAATGPLRVRTRNGHDPPRATRHPRLAVLTAARAEIAPAISPARRPPRSGRSLLSTRRHLACDCLRPISRVRRPGSGRSHLFSTPRDSGHRVGDASIVPIAGAGQLVRHDRDRAFAIDEATARREKRSPRGHDPCRRGAAVSRRRRDRYVPCVRCRTGIFAPVPAVSLCARKTRPEPPMSPLARFVRESCAVTPGPYGSSRPYLGRGSGGCGGGRTPRWNVV